ncbi:lasso peptide biosynthesis PqqD family chaperone [Streptomyces sp. H27-C3]|uniref:lasso peptide biosynthesis PqqD family chaperone n=1 Tax=Streptomyces sp. H27-C3 TaxID=3046305 RepID=UPI0024B94827|nr:lasso peptide biosynthesis PqqD family chaperone [Streptomyces sp. H27-C3]MDJ0465907.1 lasso peptide biosynthesis PqqD family chaperone [Streptomyces sp. H27-C3]
MFTLRPGVLMTETEYGIALLDESSGDYWTLNPTAASLVRAMLDGQTAAQAADALTRDYDVDREVAEQDADLVLGQLREAGLVRT